MNLVFIYGQPGVGKLTVARELADMTGYRLFHNHLTADIVFSLFPFGSKECFALVDQIRLDLLKAAAKSKIYGVIFTYVYGVEHSGKRVDDLFVARLSRMLKKQHGRIYFVKLVCEEEELRRRLRHPSRKKFRKLTSVKKLLSTRKKYILDAPIPMEESFIVDNTKVPPRKAARTIKEYYKL